jgi:oligopeptide/dipeptide ABC transporter ATP-binding protein
VSDGAHPLLDVEALTVVYRRGRRAAALRAVDGVSFALEEGETMGLVGESGSGKTTIGRAILGLAPITSGLVRFDGEDITHASSKRRRELSEALQVVFQDPYSSLNPTRTVGQTLSETLRVHRRGLASADIEERVAVSLRRVGLPLDAATRYPAHFSGGQRQRIAIARALMAEPRLVICDEPTSALDLSVQAQVLNLLLELQQQLGLSYLFVSHDLAVVSHLAHRIMVLYQGRIMEMGPARSVRDQPIHPYTTALLEAAPVPDPIEQRKRRATRVRQPSRQPGVVRPDSCPYADRCQLAVELCHNVAPQLEPSMMGTLVACHRWRELVPSVRAQPDPVHSSTASTGSASSR